MSLPRPTGLKAPSKISRPNTGVPRPSGIPAPGSGSGSRAQSALAKSARAAGLSITQAERYASEHLPHLRGPEPSAQPGSTDDFKIGDRVLVSGTKPGVIAFIGEAQFAPGEWAGVALDEPIGKNDGSVAGVRYFQCEPMKGVFSRLSKLSRPGTVPAPASKAGDASSDSHSNSTSQSSSVHNGTLNHTPARSQTPRLGLAGSKSKSGSNVSLNKDSPPPSLHRGGLAMTKHGVKLGDRVIVSGTKTGILRYVGQTDFAKGEWAGVELDEAQGKNDGAVAGKRYFDCRPNYGLFAPIHKVARFTAGATPSPQSRSLANTSLRSARERSGSQESISSVSSTASSVSRSRASKTGQRPSTLNLSATTSALQKALKEKEEHIEQLLRERDLERAEVARAAAQVDEAEGALASVRHDKELMAADSEEQIRQMRDIILELEKEKKQLAVKLEEERRKVEDLQFQIEEEVISKDDLECRTEEDEEKLRSLERGYKKEKERADKFEKELLALKEMVNQQQIKLKQADDTQTTYLDQMEELTYKLNQAENKIKTFESSRLEEGAKTSQISMELDEKSNRVTELEDALAAQKKEIKQLQDKLLEVKEELTDTNNKKQKMQDNITELTNKLEASEKSQAKLSEEIRSMKSKGSDLQRQLATSKEKVDELTDDRNRLEAQLLDLMKNSGDSSKQLSVMNDQVAEKTRKIEELQNDLSSSTQKVAILNETIEQLKLDSEKEKETIVNKSREEVKSVETRLEDVQTELDRTKAKIDKLTENSEKEKVELEEKKDLEITELKKQLAANAKELEKQEVQTQAHKQVLDQITLERETMKFEKEKAEKNLKRIESEKDAVNTELIQSRVELSKLQAEGQQNSTLKQTMEEQVQIAQEARDRAVKAKEELQKQFEDAQSEKEKVVSEKNQLQQDAMVTKADIQKKDMQIEELQKEVEKLKTETVAQQEELMQKSQSESDNSVLNKNLEETKHQLTKAQENLREAEAEKLKMTAELEQSHLVREERKKLEDQNKSLQSELQEKTKRFSEEKTSLEASKAALQSMVDNSSKDLAEVQQQLDSYKKKVNDLESENRTLSSFKASATSQEEHQTAEKNKLLDKIHSLETVVKENQKNANNIVASGDPEVARLKADKDASEKQVEFLNSVIVELQRKNDELQIRLQAMEAGVFDNGDAVEGMDISPSRPRSAPRLFCDICDMFDLHDTDDCPKQAMSDSPPASHYHGDRKQTRPYCDICEDDTRHVEGMSDPEPIESPRMTSLPDVIEEDATALKKWEESTGPFKSTSSSRASTSKASEKDEKKMCTTKEKLKPNKPGDEKSPKTSVHDVSGKTWTNTEKLKSILADELGCDEDDIGDIPPASLERFLSTESNEDYPTDSIRLQQAIFRADKAIQKQSHLVDGGDCLDLPTPDRHKNILKSAERPVINLPTEELGEISEYVQADDLKPGNLCPTDENSEAASTDSAINQSNSDLLTIDHGSTSSGFGSGELMEGLKDLDYPDWYNEKCDAEVASLELGQREEPERRIKDTDEDEELKIFEELEAKLAEDEDVHQEDLILKGDEENTGMTNMCCESGKDHGAEYRTGDGDVKNGKQVEGIVNEEDRDVKQLEETVDEEDRDVKQLEETVDEEDREVKQLEETVDEEDREVKQLEETVDEEDREVKQLEGIIDEEDREVKQLEGTVDEEDREVKQLEGTVDEEDREMKQLEGTLDEDDREVKQLIGIVDEEGKGSDKVMSTTVKKDISDINPDLHKLQYVEANESVVPSDSERVGHKEEDTSYGSDRTGDFTPTSVTEPSEEQSPGKDSSEAPCRQEPSDSLGVCEVHVDLTANENIQTTHLTCTDTSPDSEKHLLDSKAEDEVTMGSEVVGWTRRQIDLRTAPPENEEFFQTETAMTTESVNNTPATNTDYNNDESATLEVQQLENSSPDEFETPPSGSSPCITPPNGESPCDTPPSSVSPCVTPPVSVSPCVTPPADASPCPTPHNNGTLSTTPPRSPSPPMLHQNLPSPIPGATSEDAEAVTRRAKKGRSSPSKRSSVPASSEPQTSSAKGKTESCTVS